MGCKVLLLSLAVKQAPGVFTVGGKAVPRFQLTIALGWASLADFTHRAVLCTFLQPFQI